MTTSRTRAKQLLLASALTCLVAQSALQADQQGDAPAPPSISFEELVLELPAGVSPRGHFERHDTNGDGEADLILLSKGDAPSATIWRAVSNVTGQRFETRAWRHLPLPADSLVLTLLTEPPAAQVLALCPDRLVGVPLTDPTALDAPPGAAEHVLAHLTTPLPASTSTRVQLLRDLDGDGRDEVVIPTRKGFRIYSPAGPKGLLEQSRLSVPREVEINLGPASADEMGRPGRKDLIRYESTIRDIEVHDADGDGHNDLMVRSGLQALVWKRRDKGKLAFPPAPDVVLDLTPWLGEPGEALEVGGASMNLEKPSLLIQDVDADGAADLVALSPASGRVIILRGRPTLDSSRHPDQIMRVDGTPLGIWLGSDLDEDGLNDLVVVRAPEISFLSLLGVVMRGRLEIDILGYDQRPGKLFPPEPDRIGRLAILFSIGRILELVERFKEEKESFSDFPKLPKRAHGDVDADSNTDFVLARHEDGRIQAWFFLARDLRHLERSFQEAFEDDLLGVLKGKRGGEAELEIEIEDLFDRLLKIARRLRDELASGSGVVRLDLGPGAADQDLPDLALEDVDGDGRADLLVLPVEADRRLRVFFSLP